MGCENKTRQYNMLNELFSHSLKIIFQGSRLKIKIKINDWELLDPKIIIIIKKKCLQQNMFSSNQIIKLFNIMVNQ